MNARTLIEWGPSSGQVDVYVVNINGEQREVSSNSVEILLPENSSYPISVYARNQHGISAETSDTISIPPYDDGRHPPGQPGPISYQILGWE